MRISAAIGLNFVYGLTLGVARAFGTVDRGENFAHGKASCGGGDKLGVLWI